MKKLLAALIISSLTSCVVAQTILSQGRLDTIWGTGQVPKGVNNTNTWYTLKFGTWNLKGNAGANPATYFIGTTDTARLIFKVNSTRRLTILNDGSVYNLGGGNVATNTAFGKSALLVNEGTHNVAYGANAMQSNETGLDNSGVGYLALQDNISGVENTALGASALKDNEVGSYNTAVGAYSMQANLSGEQNTAVGEWSLHVNTTGSYNVAVGVNALSLNETGYNNTALGNTSLGANISGASNTAVGYQSLANSTGSNNTAIGVNSLLANLSGESNVAVGDNSLLLNSSGVGNTAVGSGSLYYNTTGSNNISLGKTSLENNTTGGYNVGVGVSALGSNTTGGDNVAIGTEALSSATTATHNVALGVAAGFYETGSHKLFIDNRTRLNEADARATALIYGVFADATADQDLYVNANLHVAETLTIPASQQVTEGDTSVSKVLYRNASTGLLEQKGVYLPTSGYFTPTFAGLVNLDGVTVNSDAMYMRVGNIITVQYSLMVDATAAASTATSVRVTLPAITANPSATINGQGVVNGTGGACVPVLITPYDSATLLVNYLSNATAAMVLNFSVTYRTN